jgi:serine/threonine protein kinase
VDDDDDDECVWCGVVQAGPIMTFDQTSQRFVCKLTNGVLLESMAARAFRELMSALAYLHMNHIAHRC